MTPYQRHVGKWKNCRRCLLCKTRKNVVIARGKLPCDVLFVGEAPGSSEDVIGQPFVGPAGHLLDKVIDQSWRQAASIVQDGDEDRFYDETRYCLTNLVACIPKDVGEKGEPPEESIRACSPRLQEFIEDVACPRLVVCVGRLSWEWCPRVAGVQYVQIVHPAAILRADVSQRGLMIQRSVVTLADALTEIWLQ